jgi:HD superfamily phosphohydrolase
MTRKIINDPVHGFITIDDPFILEVIGHRYFQRLRRIHQMAFAQLIYPGAVHTRLHHALGAYHLMCNAINELRLKGIAINEEEAQAAKLAILLHDVGHGPYSHALEKVIIKDVHHEKISLLIMESLNKTFQGRLQLAIDIFTNRYHKPFLHQLLSSQLDCDRMDYLTRDSFFTGVSEGVIGYDRILKMLTVKDGQLMVEEKGIYSIEKFLVSRRLMYWQVYLHKTVLCAERMLVRTLQRAKHLVEQGHLLPTATPTLQYFLEGKSNIGAKAEDLDAFCNLDDFDILTSIKMWLHYDDKVLQTLCDGLINRNLFKVKFLQEAPSADEMKQLKEKISSATGVLSPDVDYLAFSGEVKNTTYNADEERIQILFKDGTVKDIAAVDNALIRQELSTPVKKYYLCHYKNSN